MVMKIDRDASRFKQIVRGKIRENLRKYVTHGEMIGRKGKDLVSIPLPQLDVPHFKYGQNGRGGVAPLAHAQPPVTLIDRELFRFEEIWAAAAKETQEGYDCNTGADTCTQPLKGKMTLVKPTDADRELLKKVMSETVVPKWADRSSADTVAAFNASLSPILGFEAKK